MEKTEFQQNTYTELERIAWLSSKNSEQEFHSLMHHFDVEGLRGCYQQLDGRKAVGIDGIDKAKYGEQLTSNLEELITRMKSMQYRPQAVREVLIPKEGKAGATRPLGISNLEDKLVQKRMQELLESIYEPIFLDCSYGFRPERSCHDAILALHKYLYSHEVEMVLDVDLENFYGTIGHKVLLRFLKRKIKDPRFLRYISRMLKAGVLTEAGLRVNEEGVAQGSCCSPVMANVVAHYVIDCWIEEVAKRHTGGEISAFRYADDLVICCRYAQDAHRVKTALGKRLARYGLKMNEEKTRMIPFSKQQRKQGRKQGAFDYLGFTFYLGRSGRGMVLPKLKTSGKRLWSKLKKLKQWMRRVRNRYKLKEIWQQCCAIVRGHIQYYGVSFNSKQLRAYVHQVERIAFKWLNRRSQRKSFSWEKFQLFMAKHPLPEVIIHHRLF
ncbi:MAG: group II intron reverse transcriptase/maturase [Nitrososphaerales archaeon]